MNSELHESAAWRTFGMLDADEAAGFDEAMRRDPALSGAYREVECLTAAIAAVVTHPVTPQSGQLERLHLRLGLNVAKTTNWLGISGWAAAAAVLLLWLLGSRNEALKNLTLHEVQPVRVPVAKPPDSAKLTADAASPMADPARKNSPDKRSQIVSHTAELNAVVKRETQRLTQEIEALSDRLEIAQERDRSRFEAVPGLSRPVVMRMKPPESLVTEIPVTEEPPISTVIGDALASAVPPEFKGDAPPLPVALPTILSAISVYDPALDTGTIVIAGEMPKDSVGGPPQLWVLTDDDIPIYVGTLPELHAQGDQNNFDFSFGIKSTIPRSFILTKGSRGTAIPPSPDNTLLVGPR